MKLTLFLSLLGLIALHLFFSILGLFQAKRFRGLSRSNPWVTWGYIMVSLIIDTAILVIFWGIDFRDA